MSAVELLPCPHCGAHLPHLWSLTLEGNKHRINCTECPARVECRSSTREQAIDAWNRRAIAPPVAAGSVDTILTSGFGVLMWKHVRTPLDQTVFAEIVSHINAWGAQQHYAGVEAGRKEYADSFLYWRQRAEKAESELESWVHTNRVDELQRNYSAALARIMYLEAELRITQSC